MNFELNYQQMTNVCDRLFYFKYLTSKITIGGLDKQVKHNRLEHWTHLVNLQPHGTKIVLVEIIGWKKNLSNTIGVSHLGIFWFSQIPSLKKKKSMLLYYKNLQIL